MRKIIPFLIMMIPIMYATNAQSQTVTAPISMANQFVANKSVDIVGWNINMTLTQSGQGTTPYNFVSPSGLVAPGYGATIGSVSFAGIVPFQGTVSVVAPSTVTLHNSGSTTYNGTIYTIIGSGVISTNISIGAGQTTTFNVPTASTTLADFDAYIPNGGISFY
jgi:hypothetical protein